jgi:hypothetical protein
MKNIQNATIADSGSSTTQWRLEPYQKSPLLMSETLEILRTFWETLTPHNYHPESSDLGHAL